MWRQAWGMGTLGKLVLLGAVVKGAVLPVPTQEHST